MSEADQPSFGPCCICEEDTARASANILMLHWRAAIPGHGWGCFVCNLPSDGAVAVLCDRCFDDYVAGKRKLRFACCGYAGSDGRMPFDGLTEPFDHKPGVLHG